MNNKLSFSWANQLQRAIDKKVYRAKTQAKAQHPDFKLIHPDESRDANNNNYAKLITRITKEIKEKQELAMGRRNKIAGK